MGQISCSIILDAHPQRCASCPLTTLLSHFAWLCKLCLQTSFEGTRTAQRAGLQASSCCAVITWYLPASQCHLLLMHLPLLHMNWVWGSQVGNSVKDTKEPTRNVLGTGLDLSCIPFTNVIRSFVLYKGRGDSRKTNTVVVTSERHELSHFHIWNDEFPATVSPGESLNEMSLRFIIFSEIHVQGQPCLGEWSQPGLYWAATTCCFCISRLLDCFSKYREPHRILKGSTDLWGLPTV